MDGQDGDPVRGGMTSTFEFATTAMDHDDATTGDTGAGDMNFEAFEYQDVADVADNVKKTFDDLIGVSPVWFSVENDEGAGRGSRSFPGKRGGEGSCEMFGDWVVRESLLDVFENQPPAGSDTQEVLKVVNTLLTTYGQNGIKQRQGLEECVLAFENAVEGDLEARLDTLAEGCTQRWCEEKERVEAAQAGLAKLDAQTVTRLEELGKTLNERRSTVLAALKHEREANTRKVLASTLNDSLEEGRILFDRQVEETELEGRLKQRRHLLDLSSQGPQVQQEEIEAALLKAARDEVENLMQVMEKMQTQQNKLSDALQADKKKMITLRQHVSNRLRDSLKKETAEKVTSPKAEGRVAALALAVVKNKAQVGGGERSRGVESQDEGAADIFTEGSDHLLDVDLVDACNRLENDNLGLRQRLAKLQLQTLQKEHGEYEAELDEDSCLTAVLEVKRDLERQLGGLRRANEERLRELERIQGETRAPMTTNIPQSARRAEVGDPNNEPVDELRDEIDAETRELTQKVKTQRRKLVFQLACNVVRIMFQEAGLGPGNSPDPPPLLVIEDKSQVDGAGRAAGHGLPREVQAHVTLLHRKKAIQREIERATRQEQELQRTIDETEGVNSGTISGDVKRRLRKLARSKAKTDERLAALRALVKENEAAAEAITIDAVDGEGIGAMLRNEEVAREKAEAVLTILSSEDMVNARAHLLKGALDRSRNVSAETPASAAAACDTAVGGSGSAVDGTEAIPGEDTTQIADGVLPKGGRGEGRDDREARGIEVADKEGRGQDGEGGKIQGVGERGEAVAEEASASGKGEKQVLDEKSDVKARTTRAKMRVGAKQEDAAASVRSEEANVKSKNAEDKASQARERKLCDQLIAMRAEKQLIIKGLREKIKAAGGGAPRSITKKLQEYEMRKAAEKAKEAQKLQRDNAIAAVKRKDREIFQLLPPRTKRHISNLRKLDSSLVARHKLCLERFKKLLLTKGVLSSALKETEFLEDEKESSGPRKWTATERKKEELLHSLTPQLEQWRARIVAATLVLEEEKARREAEEKVRLAAISSKDQSSTAEIGSRPTGSREGSPSDQQRGGRSGHFPQALLVPYAEDGCVDSPDLAAGVDPSTAASPATSLCDPEHQVANTCPSKSNGLRGSIGGGGGVGGQRRQMLTTGNDKSMVEGETIDVDQARWQEANSLADRTQGIYRGRLATPLETNVTSLTFDGVPDGASTVDTTAVSAPAEVFSTPRRPPGSSLAFDPSPRSPNAPPASRHAFHHRQPGRSLVPGVTHQNSTRASTTACPSSPNSNVHAQRATASPYQVFKYYPLSATKTTDQESHESFGGLDKEELRSTATASPGAGANRLHYCCSEPRLISQSVLLSPRLPPFRQQQRKQAKVADNDAIASGESNPSQHGSTLRPSIAGLGSCSKNCDASKQPLLRQVLEQHSLGPDRLVAIRGGTTGSGESMASPAGVASVPSSPKRFSPSEQHEAMSLPHQLQLEEQPDVGDAGERFLSSTSNQERGHRRIYSSSPCLGSVYRRQRPHRQHQYQYQSQHRPDDAAALFLHPTLPRHQQHSAHLMSPSPPVTVPTGMELVVLGESVTPRETTTLGGISPLLSPTVATTASGAGRDGRGGEICPSSRPQSQPCRITGGDNFSGSFPTARTPAVPSSTRESREDGEGETCRISSSGGDSKASGKRILNACVETARCSPAPNRRLDTEEVSESTIVANIINDNDNGDGHESGSDGDSDSEKHRSCQCAVIPKPSVSIAPGAAPLSPRSKDNQSSGDDARGRGRTAFDSESNSSSAPSKSAPGPRSPPKPSSSRRNKLVGLLGPSPYRDKQEELKEQKQQHQSGSVDNNGTVHHGHYQNRIDELPPGIFGATGSDAPAARIALPNSVLATDWMDTTWVMPGLSPGSIRTTEVVYNNKLASTTTGLQSIHPPPVTADDDNAPLLIKGANILGGVPAATGLDAASATPIATTNRATSSSLSGRWRLGEELSHGLRTGGEQEQRGQGQNHTSKSPSLASSPNRDMGDSRANLLLNLLASTNNKLRRPQGGGDGETAHYLARAWGAGGQNISATPWLPARKEMEGN